MNNNVQVNKNSYIILTIIGITTLLIAVIGTTFAYFTVYIQGNPTETNINLKSVNLGVLSFEYGNNLNYENALPGRPVWEEGEMPKNILKFSLTSSTSMDQNLKVKYNIYFNITEDTFETDNLVYKVTGSKGLHSGDMTFKYGNEQDEYKTKYVPFKDGVALNEESFDVGYIPSTLANKTTEQKILIGTGDIGGLGSSDKWEFEIWLKETGEEQNIDQGKKLKGYITAEVNETYLVSNE